MHSLAVLLAELGAIFAGLSILSAVAGRLGLSPIPLYLLAGVFFGTGGLVPMEAALPFVSVGSEIGVLLLLLTLGLEFTASELVQSLRRHRSSGVVDLVLNFLPGFGAGLLIDLPVVLAVALGGITWISSSGLIARLLAELGRIPNRETPAILSVLVLEDIAMALFLPVLLVLLSGGGPLQALGGATLALGAVGLALLAARHAGRRIASALSSMSDELALFWLLGATLLVAGATEALGASAAVGAFLVGIAVPPRGGRPGALPAQSAPRPVRRGVLRQFRALGRSQRHLAGDRGGSRPGVRHLPDEDRDRLLRREAGRRAVQRPLASWHGTRRPGGVLHRHRRARRHRRERGGQAARDRLRPRARHHWTPPGQVQRQPRRLASSAEAFRSSPIPTTVTSTATALLSRVAPVAARAGSPPGPYAAGLGRSTVWGWISCRLRQRCRR